MKAIKHVIVKVGRVAVASKRCTVCGQLKALDEFGKLAYSSDGLQYACKVCGNARTRSYNCNRKDKIAAINARTRKRLGPDYWRRKHQALKLGMIAAYGGRCECCGESEPTFLSLDHVNGGGGKHRMSTGNARVIRNLRDAGWPRVTEDGEFRLLCMNCQFGYMHGRTCPHQLKKDI